MFFGPLDDKLTEAESIHVAAFNKKYAQTSEKGNLCLDAPLTLGMSTNENVDLLFPCDDIISIYLQEM